MNQTSTLVPLRHPPVSAEEQTLRVDVAAAFRLLHRHGMSDLVAGNISARLPGGRLVLHPPPWEFLR